MECVTCGGTDFIKESGYFYCSECQTQSQEVREHVFQEDITNVNVKSTKKIKNPKTEKSDNNITSWECYNIILASLTQQLIDLGADTTLKPVVKCLWMRYLEKLEVISLNYDEKPKLSIVNSKRDLKILYGTKKTRRKRKKSSSDESSVTNSTSFRRERTKKKRELAQAQYDEFSQKSNQDSSLHNETLQSIKSSSDRSMQTFNRVGFNRYSIRELRKNISQHHIQKHKTDTEQNLNCHKFTYEDCSKDFRNSAYIISPTKLYCLLYLGLLIIKDKIQLGDLFRFIREGHLSFSNFTQLFPESYSNKYLNIRNNWKNLLFSNKYFRVTTAKLAVFLKVSTYITVPNLIELSQRYCKEMNLPDQVFLAVNNLLSKTGIKMRMTKVGKSIPNYEARVMSLILFTLKLLFGLDGQTEEHLSKYAQHLNKLSLNNTKIMFDIKKWLEYLGYRDMIMSEYHYPTYDTSNSEVNSDLLLQYINSHDIEFDDNVKLTREMKDYKALLTKIKDLQHDYNTRIEYPASLTPFLSHTEIIQTSLKPYQAEQILTRTFQSESLDCLLRPNKYLFTLNESVVVKHRGANNNWVLSGIKTYRSVKNVSRQHRNLIPVRVVASGEEKIVSGVETQKTRNFDPLYVQQQFQECREHVFKENARYTRRVSKLVDLELEELNRHPSYNVHYNPYERYWLYLQMNIDLVNKHEFNEFFRNYSSNFKRIFKECSRIVEQNCQEFYEEFQFTELYLVFASTYCDENDVPKPKRWLIENLGYYVDQAESLW